MSRWSQLCAQTARLGLSWAGSFVRWTLWLGLCILLAFQIYVVSVSELALPEFVLRRLEAKLEESGLRATFSRTSFDPVGRVLMENVALSLPAYAEPVATARAVFVQFNPLMLVVGQAEPLEIRIMDASVAVPAMLSTTGRPVELVTDLDATLEPGEKAFIIRQLSTRVAGVAVSAQGTVLLPRRTTAAPLTIGGTIIREFPTMARQALAWSQQVERFEDPKINLELAPSESGATSINVTLLARAARLDQPAAVQVTALRASTRVLLLENAPTTWIEVSAAEIKMGNDVAIYRIHANVYGRLQSNGLRFDMREIALTADAVRAAGIPLSGISAQLFPRPYPFFEVIATANLFDKPLSVSGQTDLLAGTANVMAQGDLSPRILDALSERLEVRVQRFFDFESLAIDRAEVRFGEKWAFEKLLASVRVDGINAFGVRMTDGMAVVELDPQRFYAPEAFARVGDNFASGSYEQNFSTLEFRFLLAGQLRPLAISPWFREWWPNFFQQLEFPAAPPEASVDVRGFWKEGHRTSVFVQADALKPIIRGADFDRVRTRLFIRPGFIDGLDVMGFRPEGDVRGRFTYVIDRDASKWRSLDLALDSNVDLAIASKIVGPMLIPVLKPFQLTAVPRLTVAGRFTGPGAPEGIHRKVQVDARTVGGFRFYNFPLQDVSFRATLDDDDLTVEEIEAVFAGGASAGRAQVMGLSNERRLGFDVQVRDASLGQAAATLQAFLAQQKGQLAPPVGKFVQEKANVRLDFAASAEGRYNDPFSFHGAGNATLQGAELGEVSLLGALSELLSFTTLRFNTAQTNFRIDGAKLVFSEVKLQGANAAIDARGTYALDRRDLDFNAKLFPFQESENVFKSVVGAVLSPLSNVFEVKLSGSLDKPEWALLLGPTNFLRSLASDALEGKGLPAADPAATTPPTPANSAPPDSTAPAPAPGSSAPEPPVNRSTGEATVRFNVPSASVP